MRQNAYLMHLKPPQTGTVWFLNDMPCTGVISVCRDRHSNAPKNALVLVIRKVMWLLVGVSLPRITSVCCTNHIMHQY